MKGTQTIVGTPVRVTVTPVKVSEKSIVEAYILAIALGWLGAHHFYLRRWWFGIAYLFTFGLFGVGYLVDLCRIPCLVKEANKKLQDPTLEQKKNLVDAYLLWFPCGLLGLHLFYLRKPGQGILYLCTFGVFGIGWLIDMCRIPYIVKEVNECPPGYEPTKSLCAAYLFGMSPLGIMGAHHYYLNRPLFGCLYTFTLGLLGVGWVFDWFRMSVLVKRANKIQCRLEEDGKKYLDDGYILLFPLGWLGFHHFYLRRYGWGCLYFFTLGVFGLGWIVDFCRLPGLIKSYNKSLYESERLIASTKQQMGGHVVATPSGQTILAVTDLPPGSITVPPMGGMPPQYTQYHNQGYQATQQYPPQGHQHGPEGYVPQPNLYPQVPFQGQGQNGPLTPPTYDETMSVEKPGPPTDEHNPYKSAKS